jgi:DNA-binding winged helix-turn-helix (wHTH) protein/TolB-like protein
MPGEQELNKGFMIGDWEVLPSKGVLVCGDKRERPEPKVFEVLLALARRDGDLVTKDELVAEVWNGRPTADEPIIRCIAQIRKHLGDRQRPYQYIQNLPRRGYRLRKKVVLKSDGQAAVIAQRTQPGWRWSRRRIVTLAAVLVVLGGLGGSLLYKFWDGKVANDGIRSIAVLPFANLSGNADDDYLVSGFKEVLVETLHKVPGLAVKHGRVGYPDREVEDIAKILDVDAVLFAAVQRDGDRLRVNYHVADGRSGLNISSGSFTGELRGILDMQEQLAQLIRDDMLGPTEQKLISVSRPSSFEATDVYLRGLFALENRAINANLEDSVALLRDTIGLDPNFAPAYMKLATAYALLPDYRDAPLEETLQLALETVREGVEVDPGIGDAASAVFGFVYHKQKRWAMAQREYERATNAEVVDANAFNWYSRMLAAVGRKQEALEQTLRAYRMDPSSPIVNSRVAIMYAWIGENDKAAEFFERSNQLGASGQHHLMGNALIRIRAGRFDEARELVREGSLVNGGTSDWVAPVFAAISESEGFPAALEALDAAAIAETLDPRIEIALRTVLGDLDGAMRVAQAAAAPEHHLEMDMLFLPEMRPLREHTGFPGLLDELGVQAYWDEAGCVWLNDSVSCND